MNYTGKFKKCKVYSSFRDYMWGAGLTDTQSISKYNKGVKFLLFVIDIYSKYTWVVPLNHKTVKTITNAFRKILD